MIIVIDASAAIEIALEKASAEKFNKTLLKAEVTLAPDTFASEITNVFWKYRSFSGFTDDICIEGIEFCLGLVDDYVSSMDLWREAFFEGSNRDHSTYDMLYLATARRNSAILITKDKKLAGYARKAGIRVIE